jgi:hypothetical protein
MFYFHKAGSLLRIGKMDEYLKIVNDSLWSQTIRKKVRRWKKRYMILKLNNLWIYQKV